MGIQHIENRKRFTGISPLNVYNYIYKFYIYEKNHLIKIISSLMVNLVDFDVQAKNYSK